MRVLTLNAWGNNGPPERLPVLSEAIRALDPEILCLQEVPGEGFLSSLVRSLKYTSRFHAPESWLAILSRFPASGHRIETYQTLSRLEPYRRQALLTELSLGSQSVWVATTHLAWQAGDDQTRLAQAEELLQFVSTLGDNVLLSGDFNSPPESEPIHKVCETGFLDLFAELHPEEPGITWDNQNPFIQSHSVRFPDRRIDYLFLRKKALHRLPPLECRIACKTPSAELYPSDHYGVFARLSRMNPA